MDYTPEQIARVCHEANRALQEIHADPSVPVGAPWVSLDAHTRASAIDGVKTVIAGATPEQSHENWCRFQRAAGWTRGPVKNDVLKQHPCLVPYSDLPARQRDKDDLFGAVVAALYGHH